MIAYIRPGVKQTEKEWGPGPTTGNLVSGLHSKSEKLLASIHIYTFRFDKWKRKRNIPKPSESKRKDAFSDHAEDEYHLCCQPPLQYRPRPWTNQAKTSFYDYSALECLDLAQPNHRPLSQNLHQTWAHHLAPRPLGLLPPQSEGTVKNRFLNQCAIKTKHWLSALNIDS